jgi:hypothetical protein
MYYDARLYYSMGAFGGFCSRELAKTVRSGRDFGPVKGPRQNITKGTQDEKFW